MSYIFMEYPAINDIQQSIFLEITLYFSFCPYYICCVFVYVCMCVEHGMGGIYVLYKMKLKFRVICFSSLGRDHPNYDERI